MHCSSLLLNCETESKSCAREEWVTWAPCSLHPHSDWPPTGWHTQTLNSTHTQTHTHLYNGQRHRQFKWIQQLWLVDKSRTRVPWKAKWSERSRPTSCLWRYPDKQSVKQLTHIAGSCRNWPSMNVSLAKLNNRLLFTDGIGLLSYFIAPDHCLLKQLAVPLGGSFGLLSN